ncbi:fibronectin type III domain-containing protein-like isoform X1 [Montipora capricornis]|uniref:fibronectin type III domain-containing protein-like isoform X1 n=2 Tax=Montipora capricornis TaxID=246305 RepID=UPI0035F103EF
MLHIFGRSPILQSPANHSKAYYWRRIFKMMRAIICTLLMPPWFVSLLAVVAGVRQPPVITKFLQRDLVKPDEVKFFQMPGFSLPCEASGSNLTWTWKHNGITITVFYGSYYSLSQSGTLTGNYLTAEQSGSYQCFVKDEVTGIQVFSRKLQVAVTATGEFIDKTDVVQKVNLGQSFSFLCPDHKPSYGVTYSWVGKQHIQFPRNKRRGISPDGGLYITYVTQDDINEIADTGGIKCKISGANSFQESGTLRLVKSDEQQTDPGTPSWAVKPNDVEVAVEGKSKTMYCLANGRPTPSIAWKKNGQLIVDGLNSMEIPISFHGRRLTIYNINKAKHEDNYTCEADVAGRNGSVLIHTVHLIVGVAPKWTVKPPTSKMEIIVETNGTLDCQVTAYPPAKITWYKNGSQLDLKDEQLRIDSNKLKFVDVTLGNEGLYQCVAENQHGMIVSATWIHVQAWKPSFSNASLGPFELLHGSESRLHCNPSAAPRPSFQWFRNGILISAENSSRYDFQQNGTLIIKRVDKENDEGNYTCKARNFLGEDSASAAVIVYVRPSFVSRPANQMAREGDVVAFHCSANGYPIPVITWIRNGQNLKTGETLSFQAKRDDSGKYWCRGDNGLGFPIVAETILDVQFPPSFIITPRNQTVKENERATFTCSATGNPTPQITWIKDGLTVGLGKNLTFTASRNDSGKYQCLITNGLTAGIQESVDLDVHYKPENTQLSVDANNISAVLYNGQVRLTCTSHSHPAINAYRFYRFQELLGQSTTGIFDLIARDSGLYSCIPSNDAGPGEKAQVTLVVDGLPAAPSQLRINKCIDSTVLLSWVPGASHGAPVDYYVIEEESNDEPAVFRFVFNVTDPQATQASIKLSWKPATALRMKAVNRFGTITSLPTSVGICRPIPPLEGVIQPDEDSPVYSRAWFVTVIAFVAYLVLFVVVFILIKKYRQERGHLYNVKLRENKYGAIKNQEKEDTIQPQEEQQVDDAKEAESKPFLANSNSSKGPPVDTSRPLSLCSMFEENQFGEDVSFADEYKETDVVFNYEKEGTCV